VRLTLKSNTSGFSNEIRKCRWFAQCEGLPHVKEANVVKSGTVGLDLNISNVAYVADTKAGLTFGEQVPTLEREISAIQRQMQRQERTANPDMNLIFNHARSQNRNQKGKVKKGSASGTSLNVISNVAK